MPKAAAGIQRAGQDTQSLVLDSNVYTRSARGAQGGNQENYLIGTRGKFGAKGMKVLNTEGTEEGAI